MLAKAAPAERQHEHAAEKEQRRPEADPHRWPVDEEHLADQVGFWHGPPLAGVAGLRAIVAHEEVLALRDAPLRVRAVPRGPP